MSTENLFGGFFRESRKALGLNLREFCRRTGNDPGNISRLERGLVSPPQTGETLAALARALKLQPGSERWNRYFELAAAETRRIPTELLHDQAAARLPELFRRLRSGPGHRNWVTARHLEDWAGSLQARAVLPQLIRRLIHATGKRVSRIEFPSGEEVQRPGFDGVVEADEADAFVPGGLSFWEIGAEKNPRGKAEKDFTKRKKQLPGGEKRNITYVFVTPRKWQNKGDWVREKLALRIWKDVRVYDSATLEEWLEQAPGVDVWFGEMLGVKPEGLMSIDEYWKNLQALTEPCLLPEVFLASREEEVGKLKTWLNGVPGALLIETRSPMDAVDFLVAVHCGMRELDAFVARTVLVETREAWRSMTRSGSELTLIPHPGLAVEPEMVAEAVRQGHRVILCSGQGQARATPTIRLERVSLNDLVKALKSSGMKTEQALSLAEKAGGSLTVLKRLLTRFPGTTGPEWSVAPSSTALVPMLLAGCWKADSEADRSVLARLSSKPYSELAVIAEHWLGRADAPLVRVRSRWSLVSRDDSWHFLAKQISNRLLDHFEEIVLDVLGQDDSTCSHGLRTGLAETLALMGGRPDHLPNKEGIESRLNRIVQTLLENKDWNQWASLSPQMPLLAEAAPDTFLHVVEKDLEKSGSALVKLFEQESRPLFSFRPHTGLLRALEALAWNKALLPKVSHALARLDERVPAGKDINCPLQSLQQIFMPWAPQTTAPVEDRVRVLSNLIKNYPNSGWRLLISLLQSRRPAAESAFRPVWRNWALDWQAGATNNEYWQQTTETSALLLEHVGSDSGRWKEIIGEFENLAKPSQQDFFTKLEQFDVEVVGSAGQLAMSEALREKVVQHRKFAGANWALTEEVVAHLEELQRRFEPNDPVAKNAWLFAPRWDAEKLADSNELAGRRRNAMQTILQMRGWDGVLALVEMAKAPREAGYVLSQCHEGENVRNILPAFFDPSNPKQVDFAEGYASGRFELLGWQWVKSLDFQGWPGAATGSLACRFPFERKTWEFVKASGAQIEESYWRECHAFPKDMSPGDVRYVALELIRNGQTTKACRFVAAALYEPDLVEPDLIMEVLEKLTETQDFDSSPDLRYPVQRMIQELQRYAKEANARVSFDRLAQIEWQLLGFLDGHPATPATLHTRLSNNPEFLVEILGVIFRTGSEQEERQQIKYSEADQARAQNAYRLLSSWQKIPGSRVDGSVEEDALMNWIETARKLAQEMGCLAECDTQVGSVLAHAPTEEDGSWPCIPVRDALEDIGTEEIFDGLELGVLNKRDASQQEATKEWQQVRPLAAQYKNQAETCKFEWPKTAESLRRIAAAYEALARRKDASASLES